MAVMNPDAVVDPRAKHLARVKFVVLTFEPPPAPAGPAPRLSFLASLRENLLRVIGCLEAARP